MGAPYPSIPFEKQSDPQTSRMCGAACLSMVYKSLGKEVPQSEIWPAISKPNRFGVVSSITHLMAQDAVNRGFTAVAIQARHPLQVLRLCREQGTRAILNHRMKADEPAGHYSVLVDLDEKGVTLHDPFVGPARRFTHEQILDLWLPRLPNSEIVGNVLLAIGAVPSAAEPCEFCHAPKPDSTNCPRCKKPVGLQPRAPLGCMNTACIARMWNYLCCPACDYMWTFSLKAGADTASVPADAGTPAGKDSDADKKSSQDTAKFVEELDKFLAMVAEIPAAMEHPEVIQQLAAIKSNKEKLAMAQAEAGAIQKQRDDRMTAMRQQAEQRGEAHRKKVEELQRRTPPLDGDALGAALLKNLGFTK